MTYKELVDKFETICKEHLIIRDFGYGAISDIKTMNIDDSLAFDQTAYEESLVNYPYVYLVPGQSTRTSQKISYRFQMIVMDVVNDRPFKKQTDQDIASPPYGGYLMVQSDCQQYVDDIIARLRFGNGTTYDPLMDVQLSVNLTPFKERFQDTVAGMTATLEIEVTKPINECIAPF